MIKSREAAHKLSLSSAGSSHTAVTHLGAHVQQRKRALLNRLGEAYQKRGAEGEGECGERENMEGDASFWGMRVECTQGEA